VKGDKSGYLILYYQFTFVKIFIKIVLWSRKVFRCLVVCCKVVKLIYAWLFCLYHSDSYSYRLFSPDLVSGFSFEILRSFACFYQNAARGFSWSSRGAFFAEYYFLQQDSLA